MFKLLSSILFSCTETKDVTEPDNVILEEEQEIILQLEPGVNEVVLEQEVDGEIVERGRSLVVGRLLQLRNCFPTVIDRDNLHSFWSS